jgi:hypothetical protein
VYTQNRTNDTVVSHKHPQKAAFLWGEGGITTIFFRGFGHALNFARLRICCWLGVACNIILIQFEVMSLAL